MFAILVTTVGLLGAVAVFPVASSMARKGRINDASAAAGRQAVHEVDVRGMRRPSQWLGYSWNWHLPMPQTPLNRSYYRISDGQIKWPPGTAFCIDPRMIAFYENEYRSNATMLQTVREKMSLFPAENRIQIPINGENAGSVEPRMFRITLGNFPGSLLAMNTLQADSIFTFDDDLSYKRPDEDRSKPAEQNFDLMGGTGSSAKRLSEGHLSWMATLVPKTELVQKFLPGGAGVIMTGQPTDEYVLSVVVYHDRELIPDQFEPGFTGVPTERLIVGKLTGDGATGGEVELYANDPRWLKLRPNDWIMLAGVNTYFMNGAMRLSNVPAFQWYRVSDSDEEPESSSSAGPFLAPFNNYGYRLYASVIGQDWNKDLVNPRFGATNPGTFQCTVVQGVVAVYEKSVRLEY